MLQQNATKFIGKAKKIQYRRIFWLKIFVLPVPERSEGYLFSIFSWNKNKDFLKQRNFSINVFLDGFEFLVVGFGSHSRLFELIFIVLLNLES